MPLIESVPVTNVVFSAYACDPSQGSESGAGWALLRAASEFVDSITVITRFGNAPTLEAEAEKLPCSVRIVRVRTPFDTSTSTYRRYLAWLVLASAAVRQESKDAQVFHHATFASDWMFPPVLLGLSGGTRFVWGPAGGNTYPPLSILKGLARKFALKEALRWLATNISRAFVRSALRRRVDVFISLNADSVKSSPVGAEVLIHSNCVLPYEDYSPRQRTPGRKVVLFVGRLIDLKGLFLVKDAFEQLQQEWRLVVIGDGPLRMDLEKWAGNFNGRVSLLGQIDHADIVKHLVEADVLLFPGLHDTAPWASAEAAAAGLPVVCLALGGVAQMAGANAVVVDVEPVQDLGVRLARAVECSYHEDFEPQRNWTMESLTSLLRTAYSKV